MEYAVYVKNEFTGAYETGAVFAKASDAIRYADEMVEYYPWVYCNMVKLAFTE